MKSDKISDEEVKVLARESNTWRRRRIREAVDVRTQKPEMNRDRGYDLPAVCDNVSELANSGEAAGLGLANSGWVSGCRLAKSGWAGVCGLAKLGRGQ